MQTPSYIFDCYTPLSGLVFGKEQFVFREFVFWGHASRLRGIRLWDGSIFGEQFVFREFVFGKEFVFGGAICLRGIRLRGGNSSSGGNSSFGNSSATFVFVIRLCLRVEKWYPRSGHNVIIYISIIISITYISINYMIQWIYIYIYVYIYSYMMNHTKIAPL